MVSIKTIVAMINRVLTLLIASAAALFAQTFEVASVNVAPVIPGEVYNINLGTVRHETVTLGNASLADCIRFAYGLTSDSQLSNPDRMMIKLLRYDNVTNLQVYKTRKKIL